MNVVDFKCNFTQVCRDLKSFDRIYNSLSGDERFYFVIFQYMKMQEDPDLFPSELSSYLKEISKYKPYEIKKKIDEYKRGEPYIIAYRAANENNKIRYSYSPSKATAQDYGYRIYGYNCNLYEMLIPKSNICCIVRCHGLLRHADEIILHSTEGVQVIKEESLLSSYSGKNIHGLDQGLIAIQSFKKNRFYNIYKELETLIDPNLFKNPNGIHGVNHAKRVLFLSLINASYHKLDERTAYSVGYAAIYHDIGRVNDCCDISHGYRSWEKIEKLKLLKDKVSFRELFLIREAIENHCRPDNNSSSMIYKILKDCDGLDRVRLGDLNTNYLRLDMSHSLVDVAKYLYRNRPTL